MHAVINWHARVFSIITSEFAEVPKAK